MEPVAPRFRRHRAAMFGLEWHGERGTAPASTAPTIGPWGFFEEGAESACEPGHQEGRRDSDGALPVWSDMYAQAPGAIHSHNTVHAGPRAQQERGNLRGVAARRTEQQNRERQQLAIPGAAEDGPHLDLLCWRDLQ
jgi:hypothetical protein